MKSGNFKDVISQMALDHNAKAAGVLRKLAVKMGTQLADTGVVPVVSPVQRTAKGGYSLSMSHRTPAVRDATTARKIADAHQTVAQQLKSKTEVTKMMGL